MSPFLLLLFLGLQKGVAADSNDSAHTLEVLEAAFEEWQKSTAFRCTFSLRAGFAKSVPYALANGIDVGLGGTPGKVFVAKGVFCQNGPWRRFAVDFGSAPISIVGDEAKAISPTAIVNASFDEVTDGRLQIRYEPGKSGDAAYVETRPPGETAIGTHASMFVNPVHPYPDKKFRLFRLRDLGPGRQLTPVVQRVAKEEIEVRLAKEGAWSESRRIRILTSVSPPVVTSVDVLVSGPRNVKMERHIRLSDFHACPGGHVARRVLFVSYHIKRGVWVEEWSSDDLGLQAPTPEDFAVAVAKSTDVGGLKRPPDRFGSPRIIDLRKIKDTDLGPVQREGGDRDYVFRSWLWPFTGIIILVVLAIGLCRHVRKEKDEQ